MTCIIPLFGGTESEPPLCVEEPEIHKISRERNSSLYKSFPTKTKRNDIENENFYYLAPTKSSQ